MMMTIIVPPNICHASWRNVNTMVKKSEPTKPHAPSTVPTARNEVLHVFMSNGKAPRKYLQCQRKKRMLLEMVQLRVWNLCGE